MCRMLGIVSKTSPEKSWLERFKRLAHTGRLPRNKKGHRDGWGIGFFKGERGCVIKEPKDAMKSALLSRTLERSLPKRLIGHLRHASYGNLSYENTHPFANEDMIFCHNGTIYLYPEGKTDSHLLFEAIIKESKRYDMKMAIVKAARAMKKTHRYTSMSLLLLTPQMLFALRDYRIHRNYYTLFFGKRKEGVVVCSERLDSEKWTLLENGELLCIHDNLDFERCFYGQKELSP